MNGRECVVAVGRALRVARGLLTRANHCRCAAEAVGVSIAVVRGAGGRVDAVVGVVELAIAVVVDQITDLGLAGVHGGVGILAVAAACDEPGGRFAVDGALGVVAVPVTIGVGKEGLTGAAGVRPRL